MFLLTSRTSAGLHGACCWEMGRDRGDNIGVTYSQQFLWVLLMGLGTRDLPPAGGSPTGGTRESAPALPACSLGSSPDASQGTQLPLLTGRVAHRGPSVPLCLPVGRGQQGCVWTNEAQGVLLAKASL